MIKHSEAISKLDEVTFEITKNDYEETSLSISDIVENLMVVKQFILQDAPDNKVVKILNISNYHQWDGQVEINKHLECILKALTPPTQEEVCEAISEDLSGEPVYYDGNNNEFYGFYSDEKDEIISIKFDKIRIFRGIYKPKTIILIGRFYEGEK